MKPGLPQKAGRKQRMILVIKTDYEEYSGKMVLSIKFSSEDQTALDYRGSQKSFGTVFYYAYTKLEDFKRFFQEMELGKKA